MTTKIWIEKDEAKALFADLDRPSLHALSYALRHPDVWPEGFVWDYRHCNKCAMGLAHALWNSIPSADRESGPSIMARRFAMPFAEAKSIFLGKDGSSAADWLPAKNMRKWFRTVRVSDLTAVTPEMVADQIDAYLAHAE
jgi:hypothetical protein